MRSGLLWLLSLPGLWAWCAGTALAQTAVLQPSPAQQCLRHVGGEGQLPDYPAAEYNQLRAGRVQVTLSFSAPDREPEVGVLLQEGGEAFLAAVREHAKGLRVPCMAADAGPVQLRKDFVFSPGPTGGILTDTEDPQQESRRAMLSCVVHAQGWRKPEYPRWAQRSGVQGRVLVRARYANATDPPQVDVFSRPYAARLADDIKEWTRDTRLPCHRGEPLTMDVMYIYVLGDDRYGFKSLNFRQYLGHVKGISEQTLQLDTNTMGCPFDVQISYMQPYQPNGVRVIGERTPAQRPLLDWLAASQLNLIKDNLDAIWGDDVRITIPCVKIDLKPKEKS